MVFPCEPKKARAFAGWLQVCGLQDALNRGANIDELFTSHPSHLVDLACEAAAFAPFFGELQRNIEDGQQAGIVVACLWALICMDFRIATWGQAIKAAERHVVRHQKRERSLRTQLRGCLSRFRPVLHLLGARTLRRRPTDPKPRYLVDTILDLRAAPAVGYSRKSDLLFFAKEAKSLHDGLVTWGLNRSTEYEQSQLLAAEMLTLAEECWNAPPREPDWPDTGRITHNAAIDPWIEFVKKPGRPPKTPS
jgi:hypothetical protein